MILTSLLNLTLERKMTGSPMRYKACAGTLSLGKHRTEAPNSERPKRGYH